LKEEIKMKLALCTLALAASASAFAPSTVPARSSALSYAAELDDMVGTSVETGNAVWDPLELSEYVPPSWARAAELANGRSAMLATVGYVFPYKIGAAFESTDVTTSDPIKAILEADPQWWAQFIVLCGTIEGYKYTQGLNGKSSTGGGTPVFDYMKGYPDDEAGRKEIELKELKNARLAMLGIASFISAHYIPGSVPLLPEGF